MAKEKPNRRLQPGDAVPDEVRELFVRHQKALTAGRAQYAKADKLLDEILQRCEPGVSLVLPSAGKTPPTTLTIVDQFADTNSVWGGASVKRMTIKSKEVKAQDREAA